MPWEWRPEERRRRGWDEREGAAYPDRDAARSRSDDFNDVDYSTDYGYEPRGRPDYRQDGFADDPERGQGYRRFGDAPRPDLRRNEHEHRSWLHRAGDFVSGPRHDREPRRRGPSDRVLWTVIVERLRRARGLDLRDVEVLVDDAEVTLNGYVRRRDDKRRIEDIAEIDGVHNVQNNLRLRERRWFS